VYQHITETAAQFTLMTSNDACASQNVATTYFGLYTNRYSRIQQTVIEVVL